MQELDIEKLKKYKTPYYYYDTKLLEKTLSECLSIAKPNNIKIHFSLKSNFNEKILKIISSNPEMGADCVSGGEVELALKYFSPEKIVFAGIGKSDEEIEYAIDHQIFCINVESMEELSNIIRIANLKKKKINFACRINPNINVHTHEKITTGLNENKFGFYLDNEKFANEFYQKISEIYLNKNNEYQFVKFIGLHFHVGSQITNFDDYLPLCKKIDEILEKFNEMKIYITYLNLGGGCGVDYDNPNDHPIADFKGFFNTYLNNIKSLKKVSDSFNGNNQIGLHYELGRSIICQCGNLISKVNYVKQGIEKKFIVLDAGMNDLVRPAMYGAFHKIEKINNKNESENKEEEIYDVVGPDCESSDVFVKNYKMGKISKGDYVVIRSAGAYGETMASRYNCRPLAKGYLDTEF